MCRCNVGFEVVGEKEVRCEEGRWRVGRVYCARECPVEGGGWNNHFGNFWL